jgi:fructose-bisphosphate aldolase class I
MSLKDLESVARAIVAPKKGILAADESTSTIAKRFEAIKVESSEETRRRYRELLFTTPKASEFISGVILYDETIRQKTRDGVPFPEYMSRNGIIQASRSTRAPRISRASLEKRSRRAWTASASASRSTTSSARASPNGAP